LPPIQKSITTVAMQKVIRFLAKYWKESMVAACRMVSGMNVFLKPTRSDIAPKKKRPAALPPMAEREPVGRRGGVKAGGMKGWGRINITCCLK
jgi:hypothetical protein